MALRRIPIEFEINTDSGAVFISGTREPLFFVPILEGDGYTPLQDELRRTLVKMLDGEMDVWAEDTD